MERDRTLKFCFEDKEGAKRRIMSCCRSNDVLFLKLLSTFLSANDEIDMNLRTSCLKRKPPTHPIFQEGCIEKEITTMQIL
jgi:hypothetical protein